MSRENVEVVQAAFEAWREGRMGSLRYMQDPDIIVRPPKGWPEPGPYVGREAAMRHLVQNREAFDSNTLELVSDFTDTADQVVVRFVWHGAGHGPDADLEMTGVHTIRNGKVVGIEYFWDHAEALAAAEVHDAVRRSVEGINNRDMALIEGACDPDVELTSIFAAVEGRTYFGYAGARDYLADMAGRLGGTSTSRSRSPSLPTKGLWSPCA